MTTAIAQKSARSRLALLIFLPIGIAAAAVTRSVIPMLAAGFMVCAAALLWRSKEEKERSSAGVVVLVAVTLIVGIALAAYAGK